MASPGELVRWRATIGRLRRGPAPAGPTFDLCRRILDVSPASEEGGEALRVLLEGAMADARTPVEDAQEVMAMLRALGARALDAARLLDPPGGATPP